MEIRLSINGETLQVDVDPDTPLLYVLRNDLALNSPKFGCGQAQCGSCSVLLDGVSIRSCVTPVHSAQGKKITTLEGLGTKEEPHPLQQAFIDEQALQCGYCCNGVIIAAAALLNLNPDPSEDEIRHALEGHLCRCGTHSRIIKAIRTAARINKGGAV